MMPLEIIPYLTEEVTYTAPLYYSSGFISEKVTRGGERHIQEILGGNMKTHVAVCEEGLFHLRGAKLFKGGQMPQKKPCIIVM